MFNFSDLYPITSELVLLGGAILCLLIDLFNRKESYFTSTNLALITTFVAIALLLMNKSFDIKGFDGLLYIGEGNYTFKLLILISTFLIILSGNYFLVARNANFGEFHFLVLVASLSFMTMMSSDNLVVIFVALETGSFATYILCGLQKNSSFSVESAMKYFILSAFSSGFILYGFGFLYGSSGKLDFTQIYLSNPFGEDGVYLKIGTFFVMMGLMVKIGVAPFHWWLPDVYQGAPTNVSSYLATVSKTAYLWLVFKFIQYINLPTFEYFNSLLLLIGLFSFVFGIFGALRQKDIKRLLSYSSINQTGFILIALVLAHGEFISDVYLYLMIYSFMTIGSFAVVSLVEVSMTKSGTPTLDDLSGFYQRNPFPAVMLVILMLSFAGIPLTGGFIGKWRLFSDIFSQTHLGIAIIIILGSIVSVYYYFRVVSKVFEKNSESELQSADPALPYYSSCVVGISASVILLILMGVLPGIFIMISQLT